MDKFMQKNIVSEFYTGQIHWYFKRLW